MTGGSHDHPDKYLGDASRTVRRPRADCPRVRCYNAPLHCCIISLFWLIPLYKNNQFTIQDFFSSKLNWFLKILAITKTSISICANGYTEITKTYTDGYAAYTETTSIIVNTKQVSTTGIDEHNKDFS